MARFSGIIGYEVSVETEPSVWEPNLVTRHYTGYVLRNSRRHDDGSSTNGELTVNNQISIVADADTLQNVYSIRWVKWMGTKWKVTNVDVQSPRITLTLGGVFKG